MAANPSNPQLPDEADFLAWIEGEPLPRDREVAVARALGMDRALARKMEAMRADRAAIRAMADVAAPAGLMSAVEAALQPVLERQMLLGLRDGKSLADHPPISIVQPVRRSIMQAFFADRVGRRLAAAAALLLMVGGATYYGTTYLSGRTARKPMNLAMRTDGDRPDPGLRIAAVPDAKSEKIASEAAGSALADAAPAESGSLAHTTIATADASEYGTWAEGPFLPDLDGARAADLAREGRLMIRVTAIDPGVRNGSVPERIRRTDSSMVRMGDAAPPALAQLLSPPAPAHEVRPEPGVYSPSIAGSSPLSHDPLPSFVEPPRSVAWTPPPEQSVYLVEVRLDSAAMETLRGSLSGGYGEAQYEELSEPLPEGTSAVNPTSVVWWSQGPSGWTGWAGVPIVVDASR